MELSRFHEETARARSPLKATLDGQYGAHERELRYETDRLQSALESPGRMRLWWLKLTKQIPQNAEEELLNRQRTLENIEWRRQEAHGALGADSDSQRREIERRHEAERQALQPEPPDPAPRRLDDNRRDHSGGEEKPGPSLDF